MEESSHMQIMKIYTNSRRSLKLDLCSSSERYAKAQSTKRELLACGIPGKGEVVETSDTSY
jgi:hypothetical protein